MPQPIATQEQWSQVRDTAVACGSIKEAAAVHGISYNAAKQRARREKWPVARRLQKLIATREQAQQQLVTRNNATTSLSPHVTSTSDALVTLLSEHEHKTKLSLSKATMNMAQQAETAPLEQAPNLHKVAQTAGIVHQWKDRKDPGILNVAVLAGGKAAFQITQKPQVERVAKAEIMDSTE